MSDLPQSVPKIWLRSFYGFNPENDGYIGWTEEGPRDRMLGLISANDLFMIYGAGTGETDKSQRLRVLGFLQVEPVAIRDTDKCSPEGMKRRIDAGWKGKWSFAMPVRRAWRAEESVLLETIAPHTYRPEAGQAIAVWSPPLLTDEAEEALKIRVREVNVFGEPPVTETGTGNVPLGSFFKPSKAFPGSFGKRESEYIDGPTLLYVARFDGDAAALLCRPKAIHEDRRLIKVGVTNDLLVRESQLNAGFPPASVGKWSMQLHSQAYPDRQSAEAAERMFKEQGSQSLESVGGEFFFGKWEDAQLLFARIPGTRRFGR